MRDEQIVVTPLTAIVTQSIIVASIAAVLEGHGLYDPKRFAEALTTGAAAVLQPDVAWAMSTIVGGMESLVLAPPKKKPALTLVSKSDDNLGPAAA